MWNTLLISALSIIVAAVPLFATRRKLLTNPAFFVFLIVAWSLLLKSLYIALFRRTPLTTGHDIVFIGDTTPDFLAAGAWMGLVAVVGYACGYLLRGRRSPEKHPPILASSSVPVFSRPILIGLITASLLSFCVYLLLSGNSLLDIPFSAKRFLPRDIAVHSRFQYLPYYFFKISLTIGSLAYAAALLLFSSERRRETTLFRFLFSIAFISALTFSHFASLRLFILLVLTQILLLVYNVGRRRHRFFIAAFAVLTLASFVAITFAHRVAPLPESTADDIPASRSAELAPRVFANKLAAAAFSGRYFMDIGKMGHIAQHFPHEKPYLLGQGFVVPPLSLILPPAAASAIPEEGLHRYVAQEIFDEPSNSIPPGFAGELYINFGWIGLALGFLILGAFHRLLFQYLTLPSPPPLLVGCVIVLIPNSTLVLLNSGLFAALSRSVIDLGVLLLVWPPPVVSTFLQRTRRFISGDSP